MSYLAKEVNWMLGAEINAERWLQIMSLSFISLKMSRMIEIEGGCNGKFNSRRSHALTEATPIEEDGKQKFSNKKMIVKCEMAIYRLQ